MLPSKWRRLESDVDYEAREWGIGPASSRGVGRAWQHSANIWGHSLRMANVLHADTGPLQCCFSYPLHSNLLFLGEKGVYL